ncbi:MAG: alkaline phosphatase family protein [Kiloniellales bacterium]
MKSPVIAIGLDSAEAALIERWTAEGKLPTLAKLMASGAYGRTQGNEIDFADIAWPTFYAGAWPEKTGFWHHTHFDPDTYASKVVPCLYDRVPPFYALGDQYRVVAFDLPKCKMSDNVNGVQIFSWGAHAPFHPTVSKPADALEKIKAKYGTHPALSRDFARIWRKSSVAKLMRRCLKGIELRKEILKDLLTQERWDLFVTAFGEIHSVGHMVWHISDEKHPLYPKFKKMLGGRDPTLEIYQATDRALGEVLDVLPADTRVVVFSQEGMCTNNVDLPNMAMLPEILYRMSFPGRVGLAPSSGGPNTPPPDPVIQPRNLGWVRSVYGTKADDNQLRGFLRRNLVMELGHALEKKLLGEAEGPQYPYKFRPYWHPGMWYSPYWPEMRAFVPPGQADGLIRINLQGREANGIVPFDQYEAECRAITEQLMLLRDPRTKQSTVEKIIRVRSDSQILDREGLAADLVVKWRHDVVVDILDHPTLGRFGPFAHRRTGAHTNYGFFIASGPGITPGLQVSGATWVDVAPMILELLGAPIPDYMDGRSPIAMARNAA